MTFCFFADSTSTSAKAYPNLSYRFGIENANFKLGNERQLISGADQGSASLVVIEIEPVNEWALTIQGLLHGEKQAFAIGEAKTEIEKYRKFLGGVMNGFRLSREGEKAAELEKVNGLAWWYTHNMLVHFSSPHGLEQYAGAAWGTRDVCQGPTEYFMATQKYETVKEIIKIVYSHQFDDDGNWPQWFMFDRYYPIKAAESHGDIIVWPLKVLADYLLATKDYSLLKEKVPFTKRTDHQLQKKHTLFMSM